MRNNVIPTSPISGQTDDPALFKSLIQKPDIAWPTVVMLTAAYTIFGISSFAYIAGILPLLWAVMLNATASYLAFTLAHEATHSAVCANRRWNDWAGRAGTLLLEPGPFFLVFRFIHMQHHRFTNDEAKDPDVYCGTGPKWLLPLKWLSLDYVYFKFYLKPDTFQKRPKSERREFYFAALFAFTIIATVTLAGWLGYYLLLFLLPSRIAKLFITFAFDFLPHFPHEARAKDSPFQTTSNRVGMEWLLTPILIYQNYHLVHHLYPTIPFYRYLRVWNARKAYHDAQNPAIVDTFSLNPRKRPENSAA